MLTEILSNIWPIHIHIFRVIMAGKGVSSRSAAGFPFHFPRRSQL